MKKAVEKGKAGRPSSYTEEQAETILGLMLEGESMFRITARDDMPSRRTVARWRAAHPEFDAECARIMAIYMDYEVDRMAQIEQGMLDGAIDPKAGRAALSSMQWRASKLNRNKYGERVQVEHDASDRLLESIGKASTRLKEAKSDCIDVESIAVDSAERA